MPEDTRREGLGTQPTYHHHISGVNGNLAELCGHQRQGQLHRRPQLDTPAVTTRCCLCPKASCHSLIPFVMDDSDR
jgi:hypothetical protein